MAHTRNSIVINASYEKVFDSSNDINRWKEFFNEYTESEVLEKSGNKITFKLTHENGRSWTSYRLLFKEHKFAYAARVEPMVPFEFMKLIWLYREVEAGTEMTWIQDFKMAKDAKFTDEQVEKMMNEHSQENMKRFKEIIEKEANV
ncbi:MAG: SRPBCC family protein [Candidatus Omnitrophica bacterium]|nr:SRPBCC family protein [Candidatus Omnitrophota bacterium]MBU2044929.1 SRPBCC family protein [Candidatus Omnitrophota bacterium]MBU2250772.1 SRPBCC family protein [Candidatus Omnitrophota bacterium]MBU2473123.1 SRPBCC family protein [Candidatus Omnitrophota bacterium]